MMESASKKETIAQLVRQLNTLNNQDYLDVLCKTSVQRPYDVIRKAINYHQEQRKKGRGVGAGCVEECTPLTRPLRVSKWEVDLIYRGDLVPTNGILFMDVEKVSLLSSHMNVAGTVAVVDSRRELVLWAIIRVENICQYFPKLTGLSKDKIAMGIIPKQALCMIKKVLKENTVVGAAIEQDLKSLDYDCVGNGIVRTKKPKFFNVGDKCTCSVTRKKYKPKPVQHRDWRDFEDVVYVTDPYDY
ncbi:unnamed protein product [Allacma fusca]|uniref:Uncharacterized protein n=1 Tax=Allacma fusca TaxID=39272 RepID=A0A8J2KRJ2_9HEXA|nr:unnamed protein product [Allacma fusca]